LLIDDLVKVAVAVNHQSVIDNQQRFNNPESKINNPQPMPLQPGTRLGPYEITAQIGVGGMGEVYRATDRNLGRDVAIKVLPEAFAQDAERLARFEREARTLASLNHPNIAIIHGLEQSDGVRALVMELVEGPTLADRIAPGAIPVDEALAIGKQIAEALEAAHEQGIIHRDLKPANVKVRDDGTVKVLDFGLAKMVEGPAEAGHYVRSTVTMSPTITTPAMTQLGMILGTAAYMSPEQAKGKPADKRSDIWAFGCVLFEMLTGKKAFDGEDVTETIAAVVRATPDWSRLPTGTPQPVRRLLERCLEKDLKNRLPDIGVARLDLKDALAGINTEIQPAAVAATPSPRAARLAWSVASMAVLAAAALAAFVYLRAPGESAVYRSHIVPPANLGGDPAGRLAISPNGRRLVFVAPNESGRNVLWVRPLDGLSAQPLAGTEDGMHPFWSPDSRFIGFTAAGKLKRIDASGGPAIALADASAIGPGAWNSDNVILFAPTNLTPIHRVSAAGGTLTPLTTLDTSAGESAHRFPFFLPDGGHFLYTAYGGNVPRGLFVGSLDGSVHTKLIDGGSNAAYANGFLLFVRDATLMAQPFDPNRLALTGDPVPVAERVLTQPARASTFSVSQTGELVYLTGEIGRQLQWVDREGKLIRTIGERRTGYSDLHLSQKGDRVAVSIQAGLGDAPDIWTYDLERGTPMRLTSEPGIENAPTWAPDDSRIVFQSNRKNGSFDLYERPSNGSGSDALLLEGDGPKNPTSWSADGKFILYTLGSPASANRDIWALPLSGDRKPFPFQNARFQEGEAQFSPEGRWVAFTSDESGQSQVYVAPFPGPGGRWPISTGGGRLPRWRRDGKELFFEVPGGIAVAEVSGDKDVFHVGPTRFLLRGVLGGGARRRWDVAPDGQHFLVALENSEDEIVPITLVVNWMAGLK
jgi:Tol biopolymer transport system component